MQGRILLASALTMLVSILSNASETNIDQIKYLPGKKICTLDTQLITEASGIVASRRNQSVLWIHNDSGNAASLYALNSEGKLIGIYNVRKANNRDWEDIAIGPGSDPNSDYLYIGDIGDNGGKYHSIIIYRVREPNVDPNMALAWMSTEPAESIKLVYPDGSKDAETLIVDPLNGDIYVVTKRQLYCTVYHAPYPQSTSQQITMRRVGTLPWTLAVGGDVSPDGNYIIIRSYTHASIWKRWKDKPFWEAFNQQPYDIALMDGPKSEAICFDNNSYGYFTIGEMKNPPLYYYACSTVH